MLTSDNTPDDTKREIRQFALGVVASCVPLFVAWGIEEVKYRIQKKREKEKKDNA